MSPLEIPLSHNFLGKIMLNHQSEHPSAIPLLGSVFFSSPRRQKPAHQRRGRRAAATNQAPQGQVRLHTGHAWNGIFHGIFRAEMGKISLINMRRLEAQAKSGVRGSKHHRTASNRWYDMVWPAKLIFTRLPNKYGVNRRIANKH